MIAAAQDDTQKVIQKVKTIEQSLGFKPTGNFNRTDPAAAYYWCYFTGVRELPASYDQLRFRKGTKDGCRVNEKKYDVFFYPVQAVATGHTPVTQSLESAPPERVAAVVPHEDFHEQIRGLPAPIDEAASTLIGLATAAVAVEDVAADVDIFEQKAELINRYFVRFARLYQTEHDKLRAAREKQEMLASLQTECDAIRPLPRTFDRCVSAPNNAGLAFDYTYTKYYPVLYRIFGVCGRDLPCTIQKIKNAPKNKPEASVAAYLAAQAGP